MTIDLASAVADLEGSGAAPRLITADDDPMIHLALRAQLGSAFDIVGSALDADEAVALARRHQPDVALVDVEMPGGGGLRATREIHACSPRTAILALSGDEQSGTVLRILEAGAVAYVRKVSPSAQLTSVLHAGIAAHAGLNARPSARRADQATPYVYPPAE